MRMRETTKYAHLDISGGESSLHRHRGPKRHLDRFRNHPHPAAAVSRPPEHAPITPTALLGDIHPTDTRRYLVRLPMVLNPHHKSVAPTSVTRHQGRFTGEDGWAFTTLTEVNSEHGGRIRQATVARRGGSHEPVKLPRGEHHGAGGAG